jgi:chromosome partitioning protein
MPRHVRKPAHVIVLGNEKGGSGKSTTAMHVIVALLKSGARVASIDTDGRQRSLTRYIENRAAWARSTGTTLEVPLHFTVPPAAGKLVAEIEEAEFRAFAEAVSRTEYGFDYVVIDTAGHNTYLMRVSHAMADTLITPINDSFIDMDLLAKVGGNPPRVLGPSTYSQIVWEQKVQRAQRNRQSIDWIVMRNRLAQLDSKNKRNVGDALEKLAQRIGYRLVDGFSERVIFRQLFLQGLTVLDLRDEGTDVQLNLSHIAARNEIRNLLDAVLGEPEMPQPSPMHIAAPWPPGSGKPPATSAPADQAPLQAGARAPAES